MRRQSPGYGDRRKALCEDIAVLTGGKFISEDLGIKLENLTLEELGRVKTVTVDKEKPPPSLRATARAPISKAA